jgi:uncharacterized protein YndB with AHSA1/START domain
MLFAIILIILVIIPVIAAAVMSEEYVIETSLDINKSKTEVFGFLKYLRNADQFNKWVMEDPNMQKEFVGTDGEAGFIYRWNSEKKNVGEGEQEIVAITEGEKIDYEIRFVRPFANTSGALIMTKDAGAGKTNVSWSFYGKRSFGMRIFHFLFNLKKVLKKDLHMSLTNLKTLLEK